MNDKPFRTARLIRLAIFLGILFSFAWMFRWELGTTAARQDSFRVTYVKLDRWTGTNYHCMFSATRTGIRAAAVCTPTPTGE